MSSKKRSRRRGLGKRGEELTAYAIQTIPKIVAVTFLSLIVFIFLSVSMTLSGDTEKVEDFFLDSRLTDTRGGISIFDDLTGAVHPGMIDLSKAQSSEVEARRFNQRFSYRWERVIEFLKLHYILQLHSTIGKTGSGSGLRSVVMR